MKRISSALTPFYKKVFPAMWFCIVAYFAAIDFTLDAAAGALVAKVLGFFGVVFVSWVFFKIVAWDLMDEVHDCGDSLLVRNSGEEERIPLLSISNADESTFMNPARLRLRLAHPGRFGSEIVFIPASLFWLIPFVKSRIAENLMARVHEARGARANRPEPVVTSRA